MKKILVLTAALSAIILAGCGNISPPALDMSAPAVTTAAEPRSDESYFTPEQTKTKEKLRKDTFIAEFWGQNISFTDTTELVRTAIKKCSFETDIQKSSEQQRISVKSKSGSGSIDVMCIDMSKVQLGYSLSYILTTFGDNYHSYTLDAIDGITSENLISENSEMNVIVSKGKYSRSGSIQKTDNSGSHYGRAETVIIIKEDKLTVISGSFMSADMMDRQSFASLIRDISECVPY